MSLVADKLVLNAGWDTKTIPLAIKSTGDGFRADDNGEWSAEQEILIAG